MAARSVNTCALVFIKKPLSIFAGGGGAGGGVGLGHGGVGAGLCVQEDKIKIANIKKRTIQLHFVRVV